MKRKQLLLFLMVATFSCTTLMGCGKQAQEVKTVEPVSQVSEVVQEEVEEEPTEDETNTTIYVSEKREESEYMDGEVEEDALGEEGVDALAKSTVLVENYFSYETFEKKDDKNGILSMITEYPNRNSSYTTTYVGTFDEVDGKIKFTNEDLNDNLMIATFTLTDDGKLEDLDTSYIDKKLLDYVGEYTCEKDGVTTTLEILDDGNINVNYNGKDYEGNIYTYEDKWNLTFADWEVDGDYQDWFITFDGDTFTYEEFEIKEPSFVETKKLTGPLGDLTVDFYDDNSIKTNITIDGVEYQFQGSMYLYDEEDDMTTYDGVKIDGSAYLDNEENRISLSLDLIKSDDGLTYTGQITKNIK